MSEEQEKSFRQQAEEIIEDELFDEYLDRAVSAWRAVGFGWVNYQRWEKHHDIAREKILDLASDLDSAPGCRDISGGGVLVESINGSLRVSFLIAQFDHPEMDC